MLEYPKKKLFCFCRLRVEWKKALLEKVFQLVAARRSISRMWGKFNPKNSNFSLYVEKKNFSHSTFTSSYIHFSGQILWTNSLFRSKNHRKSTVRIVNFAIYSSNHWNFSSSQKLKNEKQTEWIHGIWSVVVHMNQSQLFQNLVAQIRNMWVEIAISSCDYVIKMLTMEVETWKCRNAEKWGFIKIICALVLGFVNVLRCWSAFSLVTRAVKHLYQSQTFVEMI